ncbi:MAG: hypothetical protein HPY80_07050 [Bacteroidales bacterium]|nr:hypothetical protein [Bacteroidales bacterium]
MPETLRRPFLWKIFNFLITLIITSCLKLSYAEGTRELQPNSTQVPQLTLSYQMPVTNEEGGPFATPVAPPEYRLWVSVAAPTEAVHFGFQKTGNTDIQLVIKDSTGVVVWPSSGTWSLPTSGAGFIGSWNQAVFGPKVLNPAGYESQVFNPPSAGNFYFEFSWGSASGTQNLRYYDITVIDGSGTERRGRVWSKNWRILMSNIYYPFYGQMFPYTNDRIVTQINFNGMAPARFTVACNPTGVSNTGNFLIDRKSVTGNHTYPAYKIFLNNPDVTLFPTGALGGVDSVKTVNTCDGELSVIMYVNKKGVADIVLQINPLPGVQPEDVNLTDSVYSGDSTVITWNGLDGLGNPVPSGTNIQIEVTYVNGLTHLPLYDVEYSQQGGNNWQGFIVDLVRPAGPKPKVFWDDSNLIGGTVNLTGCLNPGGCHTWGYNTGNENTVNTWWFAVSTSLVPIQVLYKRSESYTHTYSICDGDSVLIGGTYIKTAGTYYDSSLNMLGCDSVHIHQVTIRPTPSVNLGPDIIICQGETYTFDAGFDPENTYNWNTGATTSQITVNNTGTFSVTVTNRQDCSATDSVYLYVSPRPGPIPIKHNY